jgi:two-component system OmpR family sensor kinase
VTLGGRIGGRTGRPHNSDAALVRRATIRLGAQATIVTAVVVALIAAVALLVFLHARSADDDAALAVTTARADDVDDPPSGMWLAMRTESRTVATSGHPPGLPLVAALDRVEASGAAEVVRTRAGSRDMLVRTERHTSTEDGTVVVQAALDLDPEHRQLAELLQSLAMVWVAGLLLAAVAGSLLARSAVRPMETALTLQRRFVADASHELRTPLTLLSTRTQLLRRRVRAGTLDAAAVAADVDGVVLDAERLAGILDDLLLAADPRSAGPAEAVDVAATADEVVAAVAPAADAAGMTISARRPPAPVIVLGSPAGLRRAVTALADNAIRHAATEVLVEVTTSGECVVVEVTDDGPGIDASMLPRLFDRFASTGESGGVGPRRYGLGLALVSEIVDRHGGSVTASNAPGGGGAVLRVELPRATATFQGTSQDAPTG